MTFGNHSKQGAVVGKRSGWELEGCVIECDGMNRFLVLLFALFAAWPALGQAPAKESQENLDAMSAGILHFQRGELPKAEVAFREILKRNPTVSMGGKASFNLGLTLKAQKKFREAIEVFEGILTSMVDDREPGEHLMEEFMNYRHRSCLQISACYEAQKDLARALSYAELARDKHKYEAHCGNL
jgi:tetratricopeptide (TPR) repeat protein